MTQDKFRLVTRSDFDGLACAVLFKELDLIDDIEFVHPKDMQDGNVPIGKNDITTNLPYVEGAHYAFDHHLSELSRVGKKGNFVVDPSAPSAARVVYNSFGGDNFFPEHLAPMMEAVDKADSANFTIDDILQPRDWTLLSFIMDSRTGLGRFHDFRISNYQLMLDLIEMCRTQPVEQILKHPDVAERIDLYHKYEDKFKNQLSHCTKVHNNLAVIDLLEQDVIYPGNRFMVYALFPEITVSMHVLWRKAGERVVFAAGKSILNKSNPVNIGEVMLGYGGGGHANAGTCQVSVAEAPNVQKQLVDTFSQA